MDALAHAVEGYLSPKASDITGTYGRKAAEMLFACAHASAIGKDTRAMADNLLASSMANISFGSVGVALGHVLAHPTEEIFHVAHGLAVGIVLPRLLGLIEKDAGGKLVPLARVFGADPSSGAEGISRRILEFYDSLGFPTAFDPAVVDRSRLDDMIESAIVFTRFGAPPDGPIQKTDPIPSGNGHAVTVADALALYDGCIG